ncbi:uncharacterized protein LOC120202124 [Hibiscus syriacus]|uniref:uncharacterized protein LOC120202124 n=1 Tax=Hibiscus syriacus TaxID=106335 RepID=UPI00192379B2|nr:uncharacterized protein LOC120202124 [Hibiscus syriacus]
MVDALNRKNFVALRALDARLSLKKDGAWIVELKLKLMLLEQIKELQWKNGKCLARTAQVEKDENKDFEFRTDRCLYYCGKLCIPDDEELKEDILSKVHFSPLTMHPGGNKMYQDLKKTSLKYGTILLDDDDDAAVMVGLHQSSNNQIIEIIVKIIDALTSSTAAPMTAEAGPSEYIYITSSRDSMKSLLISMRTMPQYRHKVEMNEINYDVVRNPEIPDKFDIRVAHWGTLDKRSTEFGLGSQFGSKNDAQLAMKEFYIKTYMEFTVVESN